jgi:tyrosinase
MTVELQINNSSAPAGRFVTWAPSPCRIRMTNPAGSTGPTAGIRVTARSAATAGAVVFRAGSSGPFSDSLTLNVPTNGTSLSFFVAGRFGRPSASAGDVTIEARRGTAVVGSVQLMVRVRKNANTLSAAERTRFVAALAQLNNQGAGRFQDFRDMHVQVSLPQAHGAAGFLPWHRAYLLDLERELQAIDPSVALHYWRFDRAAPSLFTPTFLGVADALGTVTFASTNPLQFWRTDGVPGINRRPFFSTGSPPPGLLSEADTIALGTTYRAFRAMEGNPHGSAHVSFGGMISNAATAPRDPLFFLLHCNVDRLWARWQRQNGRFDAGVAAAYDTNPLNRPGHNLPDTMWPWNGVTGGTRPPTAPGGALAASPCASAPGPQPAVGDTLDYQGRVAAIGRLGFDYDDVPFS